MAETPRLFGLWALSAKAGAPRATTTNAVARTAMALRIGATSFPPAPCRRLGSRGRGPWSHPAAPGARDPWWLPACYPEFTTFSRNLLKELHIGRRAQVRLGAGDVAHPGDQRTEVVGDVGLGSTHGV